MAEELAVAVDASQYSKWHLNGLHLLLLGAARSLRADNELVRNLDSLASVAGRESLR